MQTILKNVTFLRSPWENRRGTCDVKIMVMNIQDATSGLHFFELEASGETSVGHLSFWFRNSNKGNIIPHSAMYWCVMVLVFTCAADDDKNNLNIFSILWHLRSTNGISKTQREGRRQGNYFLVPLKLFNHQKIFLVKLKLSKFFF